MKEELGRGTDPISFAWHFRYPNKAVGLIYPPRFF